MDADMYLYPYDVIRMKQRLGITSIEFLEKYTFLAARNNPYFPNVMLRMAEEPGKPCPFLVQRGCSIYEDRPSSCREYPLERAVARSYAQRQSQSHYFVKCAPHCQGHQEEKEWTAEEWIADQQIGPYFEMNDLWVDMDTTFRENVWGKGEEAKKKLRMALMACFNVDQFRRFVLQSSFLSRFDVSEERVEKMKTDDVEMMRFGFEWAKYFLTGRGEFGSHAGEGNSQG
jgi:Fe-S-cluster containining protein